MGEIPSVDYFILHSSLEMQRLRGVSPHYLAICVYQLMEAVWEDVGGWHWICVRMGLVSSM